MVQTFPGCTTRSWIIDTSTKVSHLLEWPVHSGMHHTFQFTHSRIYNIPQYNTYFGIIYTFQSIPHLLEWSTHSENVLNVLEWSTLSRVYCMFRNGLHIPECSICSKWCIPEDAIFQNILHGQEWSTHPRPYNAFPIGPYVPECSTCFWNGPHIPEHSMHFRIHHSFQMACSRICNTPQYTVSEWSIHSRTYHDFRNGQHIPCLTTWIRSRMHHMYWNALHIPEYNAYSKKTLKKLSRMFNMSQTVWDITSFLKCSRTFDNLLWVSLVFIHPEKFLFFQLSTVCVSLGRLNLEIY